MSTSAIDFTKPNAARVCDVLAGGRDNFAPDRELAGRLLGICPDLSSAVRENKAFIARAANWAARQGIRQFADLGCGMPAHPSAAAAVRAVTPSVRLVYVDNDPVVTAHVQALLLTAAHDGTSHCHFGAIRDNARESGPAAGRRSRGYPRSRSRPRGRSAGYQR